MCTKTKRPKTKKNGLSLRFVSARRRRNSSWCVCIVFNFLFLNFYSHNYYYVGIFANNKRIRNTTNKWISMDQSKLIDGSKYNGIVGWTCVLITTFIVYERNKISYYNKIQTRFNSGFEKCFLELCGEWHSKRKTKLLVSISERFFIDLKSDTRFVLENLADHHGWMIIYIAKHLEKWCTLQVAFSWQWRSKDYAMMGEG